MEVEGSQLSEVARGTVHGWTAMVTCVFVKDAGCSLLVSVVLGWRGWLSLRLGLVKLHKLGKIELGLLEDLDLADDDVLKWVDFAGSTADLLANIVGEAIQIYNQLKRTNIGIENTYNFLKRSLRVDFWHSATIISCIF